MLRFGKRSTNEKKSVPGVLRFGKRDVPGLLRLDRVCCSKLFSIFRFGKRDEIPGVLRFGKRSVDFAEDFDGENFVKKSVPGSCCNLTTPIRKDSFAGVLRFGRK